MENRKHEVRNYLTLDYTRISDKILIFHTQIRSVNKLTAYFIIKKNTSTRINFLLYIAKVIDVNTINHDIRVRLNLNRCTLVKFVTFHCRKTFYHNLASIYYVIFIPLWENILFHKFYSFQTNFSITVNAVRKSLI